MADRPDFSERAQLDERMDGPCSYEELRRCLRDLAVVNRITRAHRPILDYLEEVTQARSTHSRPLRVVDFGCGYGDMLRRIERWAAQRGVALELVGTDVNENAIRAAREATPASSRIAWIHGDVHAGVAGGEADVVTASGVLHHLAEPEIVRFLEWAEQTARMGWIVVDLHRKSVPYRVFNVLMRGPWWAPVYSLRWPCVHPPRLPHRGLAAHVRRRRPGRGRRRDSRTPPRASLRGAPESGLIPTARKFNRQSTPPCYDSSRGETQ